MSLTLGYLLATVGAQAGSAYFNCKRGSKQAKELARKQQEYEERVMQKGIANAQREFAEVCALQREVESQMQHDRTQMIRDNHNASLLLDAYRDSLESWPLFVPPFIIKNEGLPLLDGVKQDDTQTISVNCILTPSMDSSFNLKIFPKLEERLAQFFSKYWATNSLKAIRFYQNAWRNNISDVGSKMHDLKAHLNEVPTIVLSPLIEDNMLLFSFSWWGFSNNPDDEHIMEADNIYNPELSIEVTNSMTYNADIIETILSEATPKIAAFISFFADLYYWNYYHLTPSLPVIMRDVPELMNLSSKYLQQYENILLDYVSSRKNGFIEATPVVNTVRSLKVLDNSTHIADILLDKLLLYKDRLSSIDISLLSELSDQSQNRNNSISRQICELKQRIRNFAFPCFNGKDLFFRSNEFAQTISSQSFTLYAHAIEPTVVSVFALNKYGQIAYSDTNSACVFVILNKPLASNVGQYFSFDFEQKKLKQIKSNDLLSKLKSFRFNLPETDKIKTKDFIEKVIQFGCEVLPKLDLNNVIEKEEDLSLNEIIEWVRKNYRNSNQFSFIICYDKVKEKFFYIGGFKDSESEDTPSYFLASSNYMNGYLYNKMNNNCAYTINIK